MQGCAKKHWKMGEGIEKSEEAERGGRGTRYETLSIKLSTFLYLTGTFISGSSRFLACQCSFKAGRPAGQPAAGVSQPRPPSQAGFEI